MNPNIYVGKGFHSVHGDSVFINCSYIGEYFTAYPCTMLGAGKNGVPSVGDNVTVYTGGICIGKVELGDNCIIGANAFVSQDVLPGQTMIGTKAKVLEKEKGESKNEL